MSSNAQSSDDIRKALRAWMAIEVLTPGSVEEGGWNAFAAAQPGQMRNRATQAEGGKTLWDSPQDDDVPPWPMATRKIERENQSMGDEGPSRSRNKRKVEETEEPDASGQSNKQRPWYKIVLGAMRAAEAMERLDAVFRDDVDGDMVDRKTKGHILTATVILDEFGMLVPDSVTVASFAWGLGRLCGEGAGADLTDWTKDEELLVQDASAWLSPTDSKGRQRSLHWRDLRDVSRELRSRMNVPEELWTLTPCAVRILQRDPPAGEILSSFHLPDILRVEREFGHLPTAARAYLGLDRPEDRWDALNDRSRLSELLTPSLFPLARWPGPGLHPLTLLQQAAVNAGVRDLGDEGLFAVNGPPGTGKTTLLRDVIAHIMVSRAERLASIEHPSRGVGDIDLMDYAIVVASSNNAAVENISLELPVRGKALDPSIWRDAGLTYFPHTANHVLGLGKEAEDRKAWGLMAAKLGNSNNRYEFFRHFLYDKDWGLAEWLDRAWSPRQPKFDRVKPSLLCQVDPPPEPHRAKADWRAARAEFQAALERCRNLRASLEDVSASQTLLRDLESAKPTLEREIADIQAECRDAELALEAEERRWNEARSAEVIEREKLSALRDARPGFFARFTGARSWQHYQSSIHDRVMDLDQLQRATVAVKRDRDAAGKDLSTLRARHREVEKKLAALEADLRLTTELVSARRRDLRQAFPEPGFWSQSEEGLQCSAPWNGGEFKAARDALFVAAVRLHRAFIVAGVKAIKPALNAVAGANRNRPATAEEWGKFFLCVPVVSTTFASLARMLPSLKGGSVGWFLLDEAGQASPQHALGAVWRARRAIVIGDPLQIPPVATLGDKATRQIFENQGITPDDWAAPEVSAQTLADRASRIQGRFPSIDGNPDTPRVTGFPLLVHRRCDNPMFSIANRIAYGERMIHATVTGASVIGHELGDSAWIHVDAPSADKWVAEEGGAVELALRRLVRDGQGLPDLYVISPFRLPARNMKALLTRKGGVFAGFSRPVVDAWLKNHVGTIHTFQGKESDSVVLLLGAGRGAKAGSRSWAGRSPNMLNVAATRAKRNLYIVGNRDLWKGAGFFAEAADMLPVRDAEDWCGPLVNGRISDWAPLSVPNMS